MRLCGSEVCGSQVAENALVIILVRGLASCSGASDPSLLLSLLLGPALDILRRGIAAYCICSLAEKANVHNREFLNGTVWKCIVSFPCLLKAPILFLSKACSGITIFVLTGVQGLPILFNPGYVFFLGIPILFVKAC